MTKLLYLMMVGIVVPMAVTTAQAQQLRPNHYVKELANCQVSPPAPALIVKFALWYTYTKPTKQFSIEFPDGRKVNLSRGTADLEDQTTDHFLKSVWFQSSDGSGNYKIQLNLGSQANGSALQATDAAPLTITGTLQTIGSGSDPLTCSATTLSPLFRPIF